MPHSPLCSSKITILTKALQLRISKYPLVRAKSYGDQIYIYLVIILMFLCDESSLEISEARMELHKIHFHFFLNLSFVKYSGFSKLSLDRKTP